MAPIGVDTFGAFAHLQGPRYLVQLLNAGHFAFTDECALYFGTTDCVPGLISQANAHRLVLRYAVPFLLRYVAGRTAYRRLLEAPAAPGVVLVSIPNG